MEKRTLLLDEEETFLFFYWREEDKKGRKGKKSYRLITENTWREENYSSFFVTMYMAGTIHYHTMTF